MDLNLKIGVFLQLKQDTFDVHSRLFHATTSIEEEMISLHTVRATALCHDTLKSHKMVFIV